MIYLRVWFILFLACLVAGAQTDRFRQSYPHPDFKPSPPQNPMPKSKLVVTETKITKARFPAIDIHFHGRVLDSRANYEKVISIMD